jgi:phosphohistidine phosphatase SixA
MSAKPSCILVMRHAEKTGDPADPHLSTEGLTRAIKIASYIPDTFGPPDAIFATALSKHSARPYETVQPLADRTGIPIDSTIADQDYEVLAQELTTDESLAGRTIVVCWHHGNIPSLMRYLGARAGDYPDPWDPQIFDLILKIEFNGEASVVTKINEPF